jgi:hypothetical protein
VVDLERDVAGTAAAATVAVGGDHVGAGLPPPHAPPSDDPKKIERALAKAKDVAAGQRLEQATALTQGARQIEAELERLKVERRHELVAELAPEARRVQERLGNALQELPSAVADWEAVGQRHEALLPSDDRRTMRLPPTGLDEIHRGIRHRLQGEPIPAPIPEHPGPAG